MTKEEVAQLLGVCAAFDRRTVGRVDVLAWHQVLVNINAQDANTAVIDHYTNNTDQYLQVGHIVTYVRRLRRNRLDGADASFVPSQQACDDPARYTAELHAHRKALANGEQPPRRLSIASLTTTKPENATGGRESPRPGQPATGRTPHRRATREISHISAVTDDLRAHLKPAV